MTPDDGDQIRAIRPGITHRVHHVEGLGEWGELEIRGVVVEDPDGLAIPGFKGAEQVPVSDALAALERFRADGVRVVLVRIHCAGGSTTAGVALEEAFRVFSAAGGTLITYVDRAANSTAASFALVADIITMAPHSSFAVHRALVFEAGTMAPRPASEGEFFNQHLLEVFRERTLTPDADLDTWVHLGPNDRGEPDHAEIGAAAAMAYGWVDLVLPPDRVESLVHQVLTGLPFFSQRRIALLGRSTAPTLPLPPIPAGVVARCALSTSNYAEDASGNPIAGVKLDHTGTTIKVAANNLQIGTRLLTHWGSAVAGGYVYSMGNGNVTYSSNFGLANAYTAADAWGKYYIRLQLSTPEVRPIIQVSGSAWLDGSGNLMPMFAAEGFYEGNWGDPTSCVGYYIRNWATGGYVDPRVTSCKHVVMVSSQHQ
jgi:ATP-dependent protease ClpP protease subunit